MISHVKANDFLRQIFVPIASKVEARYLGLSTSQPIQSSGAVSGEPDSSSYERKMVYESYLISSTGSPTWATRNVFFNTPTEGMVDNSQDIQMKTAKQAWTDPNTPGKEKLLWWFISDKKEKGTAAIIWGEIKSPLQDEEKTIDSFVESNDLYKAEIDSDNLINPRVDGEYIVHWNGKEYRVKMARYISGEVTYFKLGNLLDASLSDEEVTPFTILYNEVIEDDQAIGKLTIYSSTADSATLQFYEVGIEVPKNTVPTFYEGQLQASIDVPLI